MIQGKANPTKTQAYAARFPQFDYRTLGHTGLQVSQAGFGCYRVGLGHAEHERALRLALSSGINLIDTSSNYADGLSEQLVGKVLADLIAEGTLQREEVVVVSKIGYLQGQNYELSQQRSRAGQPFPELVPYDRGLEHCMHPEFLADQLERALARLHMDHLDVLLLHNPEYFLMWAARDKQPRALAEATYYQRIEAAFTYLETQVAAGKIGAYGISSNTFPVAQQSKGFTSLSRVWELAQTLSPNHHFRVIQYPMNLFERGAATEPNQPDAETLFQLARRLNLGTLVNRPLNAIVGEQMQRLADAETFVPAGHPYLANVKQAQQRMRDHLAEADAAWSGPNSFSQLAIRALRSSAGNTCVLVGMRRETYVHDVLAELANPVPVKDRDQAWKALAFPS